MVEVADGLVVSDAFAVVGPYDIVIVSTVFLWFNYFIEESLLLAFEQWLAHGLAKFMQCFSCCLGGGFGQVTSVEFCKCCFIVVHELLPRLPFVSTGVAGGCWLEVDGCVSVADWALFE